MKPSAFLHYDRFRAITVRELDDIEERNGKKHRDHVQGMYATPLYEAPPILIEWCNHGHRFAVTDGHPTRDGGNRCPHCMAIALDAARAELKERNL